VVTGAAQGIGRRVAEVLTDEGYALALTDLRQAAETAAAVRERGGTRSTFPVTFPWRRTCGRLPSR
jgi:NAD(P)-dependent dehydrogenase (short-subunit alcohol dehydrogenase family)